MLPLAALLVSLLFSPPPLPAQTNVPAQNASAQQKQLCSLAGTVVRTGTGEPLRKARVILTPDNRKDSSAVVAYTDDAGRFSIDLVPPGVYRLEVVRTGYISQSYGENASQHSGSLLTLRPGQDITDLLFRLVPAGVISGHVLDSDGDPVVGAEVAVFRQMSARGKPKMISQQGQNTNDLGEYRISDIVPGRYCVRAVNSLGNQTSGDIRVVGATATMLAHGPTFYPAATDSSRATLLDVSPGSEISGIDIVLTSSTTFRIRGRVFNSITGKAGSQTFVQAFPKGSYENSPVAGISNSNTGEFSIGGLGPGSYDLFCIWHDEGKMYEAHQTVEITNADVGEVQLVIGAGVEIRGRVLMEGTSASQTSDAWISLSTESMNYWGRGAARPKANGSFVLAEVTPGSYQVEMQSSCQECYLKSALFGGEDVLTKGIEIAQGEAAPVLELVYSSNGGAVDGTINKDDGLPAFGATVVLVPDPPLRKRDDHFRNSTTDQYGHFTERGIPPGKYRAIALQEIDYELFHDPDFLMLVEMNGVAVEISEKEKKTLQLKLIPADTGNPSK